MKKQMKKLGLVKETLRDWKLNAIRGGGLYETQTCGFTRTQDPRTVAIYE